MDRDALEREALALPPPERARLAQELIESLDGLSTSEIEGLWVEEAGRRLAALRSGEDDSIDAASVSQSAHALLKRTAGSIPPQRGSTCSRWSSIGASTQVWRPDSWWRWRRR
jgi:hypothetical protein